MRQHTLLLVAAVLLATNCAPEKEAPVDVVALVFNPATRVYESRTVQLKTVTDIVKLKGSVANVVGGAKYAINSDDSALLSATTEEEVLKAITKNAGHDVNVSYIQADGALVPADFHSLNMVTSYYNLERAYTFFTETVGGTLNPTRFGVPNLYYFADFVEEGTTIKDNAMFMALAKGFFILPFDEFQQVPMALNLGVVGHEYGHAVFSYNVWSGKAFPAVYNNWMSELGATPGANLIAALEEGCADTFGVGITCTDDLTTCDTEFIGESLPAEYQDTRRVDKAQCMTEAMWNNLESLGHTDFSNRCVPFGCAYTVGSVLASALWRAASDDEVVKTLGQGPARRAMFQALWNAESGAGGSPALVKWGDLAETYASNQMAFSLKVDTGIGASRSVLDSIIDGAEDDQLKVALCSAFMDRFGLDKSQFKSCPATSASYGECVH